eukprot:3192976-Amphidinium_carterae.1
MSLTVVIEGKWPKLQKTAAYSGEATVHNQFKAQVLNGFPRDAQLSMHKQDKNMPSFEGHAHTFQKRFGQQQERYLKQFQTAQLAALTIPPQVTTRPIPQATKTAINSTNTRKTNNTMIT